MNENQEKTEKKIWGKVLTGIVSLLILAGLGTGLLYYQKAQQMNLTLAQLIPKYTPAYLKIDHLPKTMEQYLNNPFWSMNENQKAVKRILYIYDSAKELVDGFSVDSETMEFLNKSVDIAVTNIDYQNKKNKKFSLAQRLSTLVAVDLGKTNGVLAELFPQRFYQKINKNFSGDKTQLRLNEKIFWELKPEGREQSVYYCIHKNLFLISQEQDALTKAVTNEILKENQLAENTQFQEFAQQLSPGQNISIYVQAKTIYNDLVNQRILQDDLGIIGRITGFRNIDALCLTSRMDQGVPVENLYLLVPEKTGLVRLLHRHAGKDKTSALIPERSVASVSFSLKNPSDLVWNSLDLIEQGSKVLSAVLPADVSDMRDGIRMLQSFSDINLDDMVDDILEGGISLFTDELAGFKTAPRIGLIKYSADPLKLDRFVSTLKAFARKKLDIRFVQTDDYKGDPIYEASSPESSLKGKKLYFITKGNYFLLTTARDMLTSAMGKLASLPQKAEESKNTKRNFLTMQGQADRYLTFANAQDDPEVKKNLIPLELEGILIPDDLAPWNFSFAAGKESFKIHSSPGIFLPALLTGLTHEALCNYYSQQKLVFDKPGEKTIKLQPMFSSNIPVSYLPKSSGVVRIDVNLSEPLPFTVSYSRGDTGAALAKKKKKSADFNYYIDGKDGQLLPEQNWILALEPFYSNFQTIDCRVKVEHMDKDTIKAGTVWKEPVTGMEFVRVTGGCFEMGQTESEKQHLIRTMGKKDYKKYEKILFKSELPRHKVCVDGFWMAKYEVTNREFRKFRSGHNSKPYKGVTLNSDDQPVVYVSWNDAKEFIKWLNSKNNGTFCFRLPTEAEWEYACRAGTDTVRFWGDDSDDACKFANVHDRTSKSKFSNFKWQNHNCSDGYAGAAPVGSFQPNNFGLYDMLGNVWEWCEDIYAYDAYKKHSRNNPIYAEIGACRVFRGGSWRNGPAYVRCANRSSYTPGLADDSLGFRLIRSN